MSEHFREYRSSIRTLGEKKKQQHGLPVHRFYHAAFPSKRWNGTKTADFYRMQIVAKNNLSRGQHRRVSRVSRNKTLFFGLKVQITKIYIPVALFQL